MGIAGWSPDLERSFKEVLFRFLEEVQSTKAALYLLSNEGAFALMTQYGFGRRDLLAAELQPRDPLVNKVRELKGQPRAFNRREELPEVADYLEGAATSRALLVPLCLGSQLVGFADVRDKGRRRSFEPGDVTRAGEIGRVLLQLLVQAGLYRESSPVEAKPAAAIPASAPQPRESAAGVALDAAALDELREVAAELLYRPGVSAVALTVVDGDAAGTLLLIAGGSGPLDREALKRHQAEVLERRAEPLAVPAEWEVETRSAAAVTEVQAGAQLVASDVLLQSGASALVASVVGGLGTPAAQMALERLASAAASAQERTRLGFSRRTLARRLLEPGDRELPELAAHSLAVSRLAWSLARLLGLDADATEEAALAGLLHDVGMREVDYARLYRLRSPSAEDRRRYQEHVLVGERIVRGVGLEGVRLAVRHHHERWDGKGYPDRLAGGAIPLLARVVQVAEVYDVLTSPTSYKPTVDPPRALGILRAEAGRHFDAGLVEFLARLVA